MFFLNKGRFYLYRTWIPIARIIWNEHNPNNLWVKGMVIHHIDENKINDDIENLQLMTISEHIKLHQLGNKNCMYGKPVSEETKLKISNGLKGDKNGNFGKPKPQSVKDKISESLKGEKHPNYGKNRSEECKIKMSKSKLGHIVTEETRKKISEKLLGRKYNKTCK